MKRGLNCTVAAFAMGFAGIAGASEGMEATDACIEELRRVGGTNAQAGGETLSSEFSQAGTLVMLRDGGGTTWRCIAYSDGAIGEFSVVDTADGGTRAPNDTPSAGGTVTEHVRFPTGSTGTEVTGTLNPGGSTRYVLGASDGQFLLVSVATLSVDVSYQIFNPDGSFLLDMMRPAQEYRGQLWQSGDYIVEVINRGQSPASYSVTFEIE